MIWLIGTIGIRLAGHRLPRAGHAVQTLGLYLARFVMLALLFGGWMLICCGGGVAGVWRKA